MTFFFFFKQKTAYEMRISDWSSDVCSSDLPCERHISFPQFRFVNVESQQCKIGIRLAAGKPRLHWLRPRSEERRVGKSVSVRVDIGGRRIMKKKKVKEITLI